MDGWKLKWKHSHVTIGPTQLAKILIKHIEVKI